MDAAVKVLVAAACVAVIAFIGVWFYRDLDMSGERAREERIQDTQDAIRDLERAYER